MPAVRVQASKLGSEPKKCTQVQLEGYNQDLCLLYELFSETDHAPCMLI